MPSTQDMVNEFGALLTGQTELPKGDPRETYVIIATLCMQEFIGLTAFAYKTGKLPLPDEGQFKADTKFQPLHEVKED